MNFQDIQRSFCDHMRGVQDQPSPANLADMDPQRLELYRSLVYRNIESFLAAGFAQIKLRAGNARWHELVRQFIRSGRTTTPIFHELPGLFALWLNEEGLNSGQKADSLLQQMAHFAWVKHELDFAQAVWAPAAPPADLLTERLAFSPLAWPLRYGWPVHRMHPGEVKPQQIHLLIWRNREDQVHWQESTPATLVLVERLRDAQGQQTGGNIIEALVNTLPSADQAGGRQQAGANLQQLSQQGLIAVAAS